MEKRDTQGVPVHLPEVDLHLWTNETDKNPGGKPILLGLRRLCRDDVATNFLKQRGNWSVASFF